VKKSRQHVRFLDGEEARRLSFHAATVHALKTPAQSQKDRINVQGNIKMDNDQTISVTGGLVSLFVLSIFRCSAA